MFHPRRPRPPRQFPSRPNRPYVNQSQNSNSNIKGLISKFSADDGSLDFDKITTTAQQVKEIYDQVGPYVTNVTKIIKKK